MRRPSDLAAQATHLKQDGFHNEQRCLRLSKITSYNNDDDGYIFRHQEWHVAACICCPGSSLSVTEMYFFDSLSRHANNRISVH